MFSGRQSLPRRTHLRGGVGGLEVFTGTDSKSGGHTVLLFWKTHTHTDTAVTSKALLRTSQGHSYNTKAHLRMTVGRLPPMTNARRHLEACNYADWLKMSRNRIPE